MLKHKKPVLIYFNSLIKDQIESDIKLQSKKLRSSERNFKISKQLSIKV